MNPNATPACFGDIAYRKPSDQGMCWACPFRMKCKADGGRSLSPAYLASKYGGVHPGGAASMGPSAAGPCQNCGQWEGVWFDIMNWAQQNPQVAQYFQSLRQARGV